MTRGTKSDREIYDGEPTKRRFSFDEAREKLQDKPVCGTCGGSLEVYKMPPNCRGCPGYRIEPDCDDMGCDGPIKEPCPDCKPGHDLSVRITVDQRVEQQRKGEESFAVKYYPYRVDVPRESYLAFTWGDYQSYPDRRESDRRRTQREAREMKVITLWQPWATWVVLGWKTIETRLHPRFSSLAGQTIGIHAGLKWDDTAIELAEKWLSDAQILLTKGLPPSTRGALIGTVSVIEHRLLTGADSKLALIDCENTQRFGLILERPITIEPVYVRGKQGIWNMINLMKESA